MFKDWFHFNYWNNELVYSWLDRKYFKDHDDCNPDCKSRPILDQLFIELSLTLIYSLSFREVDKNRYSIRDFFEKHIEYRGKRFYNAVASMKKYKLNVQIKHNTVIPFNTNQSV